MKKLRTVTALALAALLSLSAVNALAKETAVFSADDLNVNAVYAGASPADVHEAFGSPVSSEQVSVPATGDTQVVWRYDSLPLTFIDEALISAQWSDPTLTGPRGLKIGDGEETVVGAFYADASQADPDVLYTAGWVAELGMQLPPSGVISHEKDGTFTISYLSPMVPYDQDVLDDPMNFVYQSHASLTFSFSLEGTLTDIRWDEGALAE
jgi:hypothetical protein